jgi:hypothetical protein
MRAPAPVCSPSGIYERHDPARCWEQDGEAQYDRARAMRAVRLSLATSMGPA